MKRILRALINQAGLVAAVMSVSMTVAEGQVSAPVFAPPGGAYGSMRNVAISASGATTIYCTTDGSTPTSSGTLYSTPVLVGRSLVLKAMGYNGSSSGPVTTGTYSVTGALGTGNSYVLALTFQGTVWGWGSNASGELGNGTTVTPEDAPVLMGGTNTFDNVIAVDGGSNFSAVLTGSGTVAEDRGTAILRRCRRVTIQPRIRWSGMLVRRQG